MDDCGGPERSPLSAPVGRIEAIQARACGRQMTWGVVDNPIQTHRCGQSVSRDCTTNTMCDREKAHVASHLSRCLLERSMCTCMQPHVMCRLVHIDRAAVLWPHMPDVPHIRLPVISCN